MKRTNDFLFMGIMSILILTFCPFTFLKGYQQNFLFNPDWWIVTSFLKFAVLATLGESLGLRIRQGVYNQKGFGLLPRAIVWGCLGITIKIVFVIFTAGVPVTMVKLFGLQNAGNAMNSPDIWGAIEQGFGWSRIITAFAISLFLHLFYAPLMMTVHKITDTHIVTNEGTLSGFWKPIDFPKIMKTIDWNVTWNFVFKKTIPVFWIPAHTVTFLIPGQYRIVFAAVLGIVLGCILAIASIKGRTQ